MASWHIALIEPQSELLASRVLRARGYEVYWPTFPKSIHHTHGYKRIVYRPLFPGYMFVNQSAHGWDMLRTAPGVRVSHSLLMINGRYAVLPDLALDQIQEVEKGEHEKVLSPKPTTLPYRAGDTVRVIDGPFTGFNADIVNLDDHERISLLMSIFGRESRVYASHKHLAAL